MTFYSLYSISLHPKKGWKQLLQIWQRYVKANKTRKRILTKTVSRPYNQAYNSDFLMQFETIE